MDVPSKHFERTVYSPRALTCLSRGGNRLRNQHWCGTITSFCAPAAHVIEMLNLADRNAIPNYSHSPAPESSPVRSINVQTGTGPWMYSKAIEDTSAVSASSKQPSLCDFEATIQTL